MSDVVLTIAGMTCGGCVNSVTRVLQSTPGVKQATVSLLPSEARVSYDETSTDPIQLAKAVSEAGFTVTATRSPES